MAGNMQIEVSNQRITVGRGVFDVTRRQMQAMSNYLKNIKGGSILRAKMNRFIRQEVQDNFRRQEDSRGRKWPELSKATQNIRRRAGIGPSEPKLIAEGDMYRAVTGQGVRVTFSRDGIKVRPSKLDHETLGKIARHNKPVGRRTANKSGFAERFNMGPTPGREFFYIEDNALSVISDLIIEDVQREAITKSVRGHTPAGQMLNILLEEGRVSRRRR